MLLAWQSPFAPYHQGVADSHYLDLSKGFEGYQQTIQQHSAHLLKEMRTKRAKLDKNFADVRFSAHGEDIEPLRVMFAWKQQQYAESGLVNVFGFPWTRELLERIHAIQTPHFSGMLSSVRLDGTIVAVHMGMRSATVWNWWFPRHDETYSRYSPGMLLRMHAAQVAADFGVRRIDLGQGGPESYKPRLRTGGIPLAAGRVEIPSLVTTIRQVSQGLEAGIRKSPLMPLVRWPGRIIKRIGRSARFR
jgi:CelD/BcsL family acetyltransferase involved in cellulose biosynthesis